jgi:hypothetical protein
LNPIEEWKNKKKSMVAGRINFEIELPDSSVSLEEWRRAQALPASELPKLSSQEKEAARKFGISEEAYARSSKAGEFGRERMLGRAQRFGECVDEILKELGSAAVDAVKSDPFRGRWLVRLKTPESIIIEFPRELVDDLLDSGAKSYLEQVRRLVRDQVTAASEKTNR